MLTWASDVRGDGAGGGGGVWEDLWPSSLRSQELLTSAILAKKKRLHLGGCVAVPGCNVLTASCDKRETWFRD